MNAEQREQAFHLELEKAYKSIYRKLYMKNYYATKQNELKMKSLLNYHKNKNTNQMPVVEETGLKITRQNKIVDFNI